MSFILAIDQGTTSTRSIIFDEKLKLISTAQEEFSQHFPQSGWVEHNPEEIWSTTKKPLKKVINKAKKLRRTMKIRFFFDFLKINSAGAVNKVMHIKLNP